MGESFDRDRIRRGCSPEKKELSLKEWMKECDFLNEYVLEELENKNLYDSLERVCIFYIRKWKNQFKVLPHNLEMERMYIEDDLYQVTDVILGVYTFVKNLVAQYPNGTKFQCEFCVAIRSTKKLVLTKQMVPDLGQDEEPPDESKKYQHLDKINNVVLNMQSNQIPHIHKKVADRQKLSDDLMSGWKEFKQKIEAGNYKERKNTFSEQKNDEQRKKYYSPFPKQRRFCCFIDRREYVNKTSFHKQLRKMDPFGHRGGGRMMDMFGMMGMYEYVRKDTKVFRDQDVDEFTFFIPDDQYLPIDDSDDPNQWIYPESMFNIMHDSMLPPFRIYDEEKEEKHVVIDRMTGITSHSGSTFNLQFQIERYDEIRMYVHWHNQCIRLFPEDFWLVFPRIFVTDPDMGKVFRNREFAKDLKMREKIRQTFCNDGQCPDRYFNYFYKYMSVYGQQKKEWIDKPTEVKYVN